MAKTLGIDLGTNSLGWALVDDENREVVDMGVRIFPEGYDKLGQGDSEVTRNVQRRMARMMRRQIERRRRRKIKLLNWLKRHGLFPWERTDTEPTTIDPYKLRHEALSRRLEPHELGLALYHLNQRRGFLSNSKKGYTSEKSEIYIGDGDAVGLKKTMDEQGFDPATMTFGQFLDGLSKDERKRARYALRSWYRDEFDRLWDAQRPYYPDLLTEANRETVGDKIIFYQRPLKSQKKLVGFCEFEKTKRRAPASCHDAQLFRMLQQVNNLTIEYPGRERLSLKKLEGENSRDHERREKEPTFLTASERQKLYDYLACHKELKIEDLGKVMGIPKEFWKDKDNPKNPGYRINLRGLRKLSGCRTRSDIREAVGEAAYKRLTEDDLEHLWQLLYDYQYDTTPKRAEYWSQKIERRFGWDEDIAGKLGDIKLEDGYSNLSRKALRNINPFLKEGLVYSDACQAFTEAHPDYPVKYHHSDKSQRSDTEAPLKNSLPDPDQFLTVRNPIVSTCLYQVRAVVNALIKRYGRPDKIRIELAREITQNKAQRYETFNQNKDREELNLEARKAISEVKKIPIEAVSKSDIIRYRLWMDQDKKCAYTGKALDVSRVFGGDVDIDHILPLSLSQDDSYMNKVVCLKSVNLEKGQRTPFEAFGHDAAMWSGINERVAKWPSSKKRRMLTQDTTEFAGFRSSQLVNTRYATRASLDYLRLVCPKVEPVNGHFTAMLREVLGLNSQKNSYDRCHSDLFANRFLNFDLHPSEMEGNKSRLDHRHHAVDALVIALSERNLIQRAHTFMARRIDTGNGNAKAEIKAKIAEKVLDWPDLVEQVKNHLACMIVSFKKNPIDKVQGKMHKETVYGLLCNSDGSPRRDEKGSYLYASREKLSAMEDSNSVEYIVDPVIRRAARNLLREKGVDVDKKDKNGRYKYEFKTGLLDKLKHPATGKVIRAARVYSPGERRFSIRNRHKAFKNYDNAYVQNDCNHHVAVYETFDKKGKRKQIGEIVTLIEAYRRKREGLPIVNRVGPNGERFLYALQINDLFLVCDEAERDSLRQLDWSNKKLYKSYWDKVYRLQKMSQQKQLMFRHHSLSKIKIKDSTGSTKEHFGRLIKTDSSLVGLKLKIDPAGYLSIADE